MTALYEKREIVCNEKSDVYVTHRNRPDRKQAVRSFLTSKSFLA